MNIFKRLLRKELGRSCYDTLIRTLLEPAPEAVLSQKLYSDIYEHLRKAETERLLLMKARLNDVIMQAFQVSRTYSIVFFVYLAAWFFLMGAGLPVPVLLGSVAAISFVFLAKTIQFLSNRCQYIDAKVIEVYKIVMDRLIHTRLETCQK